jgi:predicted PurR-regulated permease PerM
VLAAGQTLPDGITWALALAVVAYPLNHQLERRLRPTPAALLSVLAVVFVLLAPGALLIQKALEEAGGGLGTIGQNFSSLEVRLNGIRSWREPSTGLQRDSI